MKQNSTAMYLRSMVIRKKKSKKRVQETFETIFHGSEEERFYHEAGEDMGFMEDTGNHDARPRACRMA